MQSSDIVRKRLIDLKKLSQNLKQSTKVANQPDVNLIKAILEITKNPGRQYQISQSAINFGHRREDQQSIYSSPDKANKQGKGISSLIISKHLTKTHSLNYNRNFDMLINEENIQPLFPQNGIGYLQRKLSSSNISKSNKSPHLHNAEAHEEELVHLRQENIDLEKQSKEMKQKLREYEEREQKTQRNKGRGISSLDDTDDPDHWQNNNQPYFKLNEAIHLFFTKITVAKQDYHRVQCTQHTLKLTLDRIIIQKIYKPSSSRSINSQVLKNPPKHQLNLSNLMAVEYLEGNRLLLIFGQEQSEDKMNLFLQFGDFETMHRWDLGIYINFKIVSNLNTEKIFMHEQNLNYKQRFSQLYNDSMYRQSETDSCKKEEREALKKYLEDKKKYVQSQKHLKNIMLHKINIIKQRKQSLKSSNKSIKMENKEEKEEKEGYSNEKQKNQSIQIWDESKNLQKEMKNQSNVGIIRPKSNQKQVKTDDKKEMVISQQEKIRKMKQQQQQKQLQHKRKVKQAISLLKKGMYMTKHTKSAFKPHEKQVFISQDCTKLCWQDKDSTDSKCVKVSEIQSISRGQIGPGIEKHVGKGNIKDLACFILINTSNKDRKQLQFEIKSSQLMDLFAENLQLFLSQFKMGNLHSFAQ